MQIAAQSSLFDIPARTTATRRALRPATPSMREPRQREDLFGQVPELRFSTRFFSGASATNDAAGIIAAGLPLGVAATEMRTSMIFYQMRNYLRDGHQAFCDSGVFGNFMARGKAAEAGLPMPAEITFEEIFGVYDRLIAGLSGDVLGRLFLVMPDAIGDQGGSLALARQHREKIRIYIDAGIDVIIPIQRGEKPAQAALLEVIEILGTADFRAGVPSKAEAMSEKGIRTLRHGRFHILGRAAEGLPLRRRAYALIESNPGADLTCDANMLRPFYSTIAITQNAARESLGKATAFADAIDDTELAFSVLNDPDWMSQTEVEAVATAFGRIFGPQQVKDWIAAHKKDGLKEFIASKYSDEAADSLADLLYRHGLPAVFHKRAASSLSKQARVSEIKAIANAIALRFDD